MKPTTSEEAQADQVVPRESSTEFPEFKTPHMAIPMDTPIILKNPNQSERRRLTTKEVCEVCCGILTILAVLIGIGVAMFFILGYLSKAKYT